MNESALILSVFENRLAGLV